jgi:hypothetical protein
VSRLRIVEISVRCRVNDEMQTARKEAAVACFTTVTRLRAGNMGLYSVRNKEGQ